MRWIKNYIGIAVLCMAMGTGIELRAQVMGEVWRQVDSVPDTYGSGWFNKAEADGTGGIYTMVSVDGDIEMLRYDSSLNIVWRSHFQSNTYQYDYGRDFVVTASGLIYVTGNVWEPFSDENLFVACLDTNGTILWERTWDGPTTMNDYGFCITVLPNGNVAVGGKTENTSNHYYGLIMLWSATGNYITHQMITSTSWWSGLNNTLYQIEALPDGRIVACGEYKNTLNGKAGILSCYDSTLSTLLWSDIQTSGNNFEDKYLSLTISANRICVGGVIEDATKLLVREYDFSGNRVWTVDTIPARGCSDLFYTSSGEICAGFSDGDISVVKFSAAGNYLWRYDYVSPLTASSIVYTVELETDAGGSILISTRSILSWSDQDQLVICINAAGAHQWHIQRDGTYMSNDFDYITDAVFTGNHIIAVGKIGDSLIYNIPSLFSCTLSGMMSDSAVIPERGGNLGSDPRMALDSSGNVFIAGRAFTPASNDVYIAKRDRDGNLLWSTLLTDSGDIYAEGICTDRFGNVCITGYTYRMLSGSDAFTCKYDGAGNLQWLRFHSSPGAVNDGAKALSADSLGCVYVATQMSSETEVLKYSPAGGLIWSRQFSGNSSAGPDSPWNITLDGSNTIYLGIQEYNSGTGRDIGVVKIDSAGNTIWHTVWATVGTERPEAISLFSDHSIGVGGTSSNTVTGYDFLAMRIDTDGTVLWDTLYEVTGSPMGDEVRDVVCLGTKMYLCGFLNVTSTSQGSSLFVLVLDTAGQEVWQQLMFLSSGGGKSIAVSPVSGIVGVAGGGNLPNGFRTVFFDSAGTILDTAVVGIDHSNAAYTIETHQGAFYVNGTIEYNYESPGYPTNVSMTVKYCQGPVIDCASDTIVCAGATAQLSATPGFMNYQWTPSATLSSDTIANPLATPGSSVNYTVTATNLFGCVSNASQQVAVRPLPSVSVTPSPVSVCAGDTVQVSVQGAVSYNWLPEVFASDTTGNTNSFWPPSSHHFHFIAGDAWGCNTSDSVLVTVLPPPAVLFISLPDTVCIGNGTVTLSAAPAGGIFSGPGVSGTTFDPVVTGTGNYVVTYLYVDSATGCSALATESFVVDSCTVGIDEYPLYDVTFSPNPASSSVFVESSLNNGRIVIYNAFGEVVKKEWLTTGRNEIAVGELAPGMYYYQVESPPKVRGSGRFIKE